MSAQTNVAPVIIKRKKVSGGDGHHGGAWKVAYADFVTAMMAFFMLMLLLNATTEKQRKGLADYFAPTVPIHRVSSGSDAPFGGNNVHSQDTLTKQKSGFTAMSSTDSQQAAGATGVDRGKAEIDEALKTIEEALNGRGGESLVTDEALKHIVTRVTDEGLVIDIFDDEGAPLFDVGSNQPTPLMRELTAMIGRVIGTVENGVAIGGHVRANPVVLAADPVWDLSSARAARVRSLLEAARVAPARLRRVTGHADRDHAVQNPMAARNNRIEIILLRNTEP